MRKRYVTGIALGIFLFVMIFVSGCGGGFAMSSTEEKQTPHATGKLTITINQDFCLVNITGENHQEYGIEISNGILERTLPIGKYTLEFFYEQYEKRTSYIEIRPDNSVDFVVDFTQPQNDKNP